MMFVREEKIRFQHIDYAGIVFYPRFLEMLNALVEDWFAEALNLPFSTMHKTHGIPTVDLKVQFKAPARLDEVLKKQLWVKELGGASLLCGFRFENPAGKTVLEGEVTLVNVAIAADRNNIKAEAFTDSMKMMINTFQL